MSFCTRVTSRGFSVLGRRVEPQVFSRALSTHGTLTERVRELVPKWKADFSDVKKTYGAKELGAVHVESILGGMRGITGMVYETSLLDADEGIRFRGMTIPEIQQKLPRAKNGQEPLPEGLLWLLLTGEVPTQQQVANLTEDLHARSKLPAHVSQLINSYPKHMHAMTQLCSAVLALQTESKFAKLYEDGKINKNNAWESTLDDSLNLIARLPQVAAMIYRNKWHNGKQIAPNHSLDWGANYAEMLGYPGEDFKELMRLYLTIHSDHEGGNVSAHATHLVGSALSDPYLSYTAGMTGLAGPLHGLANQEVLRWIMQFKKSIEATGASVNKESITKACWDTLNSGRVIPGFGHAVLRKTDPRYLCQREFALKHLPNDPLFRLVSDLFEVVPGILTKHGKTKNPFPNVDAHSGVLLQYYGLKEEDYYTVLFGVSRGLGVLSHLVISRALGLPIERPKSVTTEWIRNHFKKH